MSVQKINSQERPLAPMYSHAVKIPGLVFCSGQIPADSTGNVVPGDIKVQCLSNLSDVLKTAGSSWDKVVKVNIYLKNMGDFAAMNEEYIKAHPKPARTCIQAGGLPLDVDIEIEAIAAV
ncbi:Endoribonuclease L-PSP [Suillus bovinus]|uniref:Endoribonuclease L-PSP n=1 Tax=Suillus bovinus TaxID=48563 RepID=UPI001B885B28|nr:Endoribonuclease L-PSP [Suillus bovinus]KAG2159824.1 Endoribonuclease L-PSP [Suillus bovinus]